jgi:hypothetical protein
MDKETYHLKLEDLIVKVKLLKNEIQQSNDIEKIGYLKLALQSVHEEIKKLMNSYYKSNIDEKKTDN